MRARLSMATSRKPQEEREAQRFFERVFEHFGQTVAVEFAGQPVAAGEKGQLALVLIAFVDDAQHAMRALRTAVRAGEPAAGVLDPEPGLGRRVGTDDILDLIGDAVAVVALVGLRHDVEAGLGVIRLEQLRISAAAGNCRDVGDQQNAGGVGAPRQRVGIDVPVIGHLADRSENCRGIELRACRAARCWPRRDICRPFSVTVASCHGLAVVAVRGRRRRMDGEPIRKL